MLKPSPLTIHTMAPSDFPVNWATWADVLRSNGRSEATLRSYHLAIRSLVAFLEERNMPTTVSTVTGEHLREFIRHVRETRSANTAGIYFRSLRAFFRWLTEEEGELTQSPMARIKHPPIPEMMVPVLREEELRAIMATCEKARDLEGTRDYALLRVMLDTGLRLGEVTRLRYHPTDEEASDLALSRRALTIAPGKTKREREVGIGDKAALALRRYLRRRDVHPAAKKTDALWIGHKGPLSQSGVAQIIKRRGEQAGIKVHPHQLRHTWAHRTKAAGMSDGDVQTLGGWTSPAMLARYGASTRSERALEAFRRLGPNEDL
jgi:site-specific recombinase XerD